ncbi:M24 family metallopeptidase [Halobellus sp. GM3]|uniref:M24 family metallopeptidase n=1 Tax=Halobellus sp. GM3 TaxID=3458410 RepID=UPI00403E105A
MLDSLISVVGESDIDGALLYTDGMHSIAQPSYLEYVAGVTPIADQNGLFVSSDGDVIFLVDLLRDVGRIKRHTGINDVRGVSSIRTELLPILEEHGIGSLGIAGKDRMDRRTYSELADGVETVISIEDRLFELTRGKDTAEREIFRKLARIADAGFEAAYEAVRPGIMEYELAAEVEQAMRSAGATDNFNLFSTGTDNQLMHAPRDRIVQQGDVLLCELSPMYRGRILQICRTIAIGTPDEQLTAKYALLREAMARTKQRLTPGVEASTIATTMNEVFRDAGYAEYCKPPYMRTRGHEFGVGPIGMSITEETETELQDGMVLVVHPNQYIPETGYLALGDPLIVTENGVTTLTRTDARLFTKEVI